ncbi:LPXTG cell wall anchor domain-containing protein [Kitasatospora sp. NPDC056531]|uniref:LPXTG cell wall anchor domain-containing protein n=1 Tax=Kitasatospora sp. NPDC056531 TaxID=3345856 RepID=UPI0036C7CD57
MRSQSRRFLAAAATTALVSGLALTSAPAAVATPTTEPTAPAAVATPTTEPTTPAATPTTTAPTLAPHGWASPVVITTSGFPTTVTAGSAVEFTSTLKNTADHQLDAMTGFGVSSAATGLRQSQLKLEYQRPGSTQWQDAKANNGDLGGFWELDQFATALHLAAGAEATYRLRLTFAADATPGQAAAALDAMVSDPTLPTEQRVTQASGGTPNFTIVSSSPNTPVPVGLPDVKVQGVPASFTAGGEAKPFKVVYGNHTGKDLRIVPTIVFQGEGMLRADMVKIEFQTRAGDWIGGTPEWHDLPDSQLGVRLLSGSEDADVIALPNGETRTVNLRLAWTKGAPAAAESVFANGWSLAGPGGHDSAATSPKVAFRIEAAAGSTGIPAPTSPATDAAPTTPAATADPSAAPAALVTTAAPNPAAGSAQAAAAPAAATSPRLASTGGDSSSAPMAITGAMAIALGLGTLVVARRRKGAQGAGK